MHNEIRLFILLSLVVFFLLFDILAFIGMNQEPYCYGGCSATDELVWQQEKTKVAILSGAAWVNFMLALLGWFILNALNEHKASMQKQNKENLITLAKFLSRQREAEQMNKQPPGDLYGR